MGRRGPLPKSAELRAISGSERRKPKENPLGAPRSQLKSVRPLGALPPLPAVLAKIAPAREEYLEVGPQLVEAGLLTRANLQLFVAGCLAIGKIMEAADPKAARKAPMNQSLLGQYRAILTEFGLTPTSQLRRGGPEAQKEPEKEPENPFEANNRRAA